MKSYEQLAREAYEVYRDKVIQDMGKAPPTWSELELRSRIAMTAAVRHLWSAFSSTH